MSASKVVPLTGKQKGTLHELAAKPFASPDFARAGTGNPRLRVFVANFDGTYNDMAAVPLGEKQTLVADSHSLFHASDPNIESRYYKGVGTTGSRAQRRQEAALGIGCVTTASRAYSDLCEQVRNWREENPDIEVHVHVTGFSRGCASALKFMNMVDKQGITMLFQPEQFRPGAVKSSAVLLDAVTTGVTSALVGGIEDGDLQLPDSTVSCLHLTAGGEERTAFKLTSLLDKLRPSELAFAKNVRMEGVKANSAGVIRYKRLWEIMIPAARHSDVGGSYVSGGMRDLSLYLMREFQRTLGLPAHGIRPSAGAIQGMWANDSRWVRPLGTYVTNRQKAERDVAVRPKALWKGRYTEQVSMTVGRGGVGRVSERTRIVTSKPSDWKAGINPSHLGGRYILDLSLATNGATPSLLVRSNCAGAHAFDKDGVLMLHGRAVQGAPAHSELLELVEKNGVVKLDIGFEKAIPVFDAKQVPGAPLPAAIDQPPDMWPTKFSEALKVINDRGRSMRADDAGALFYECLKAADEAVRGNFASVTTLGIETAILGEEENAKTTVRFKCVKGDRQWTSENSACYSREDFALCVLLKSLREGLECVAKAMADERLQALPQLTTVFGRAANAELDRESSMMPPTLGGPLLGRVLREAEYGHAASSDADLIDEAAPVRPALRLVACKRM